MFALVDCNNFYASCERVFNPAIIHRLYWFSVKWKNRGWEIMIF